MSHCPWERLGYMDYGQSYLYLRFMRILTTVMYLSGGHDSLFRGLFFTTFSTKIP